MVDTEKLREVIKNKGLKYGFISKELGISRATLKRKLENETEFKLTEVKRICDILGIKNEFKDFFLANT